MVEVWSHLGTFGKLRPANFKGGNMKQGRVGVPTKSYSLDEMLRKTLRDAIPSIPSHMAPQFQMAILRDELHEINNQVTEEFLKDHDECVFVFGDNLERKGKGGAAALRHLENTYGFVTKKAPNNEDASFFKVGEYRRVFSLELEKLSKFIESNPSKVFLVSKIGSGLANRNSIFEKVIKPQLETALNRFKNVIML